MSLLNEWLKSSSPMVKVLMAISITSGLVVVNKWYYAPYVRKQRHLRAEKWADFIIEQEETMKESSENH